MAGNKRMKFNKSLFAVNHELSVTFSENQERKNYELSQMIRITESDLTGEQITKSTSPNQVFEKEQNEILLQNRQKKIKQQEPFDVRFLEISYPLSKRMSESSFPKGYLQNLVRKNKVQRLVVNFVSKLKRNVAFRTPSNQNPYDVRLKNQISIDGITISHQQMAIFNLISIFLTLTIFIMYSIFLIFPEAQNTQQVTMVKLTASVFFFIQIVLQFTVKKLDKGRTLKTLRQISENYLKSTFPIDFIHLLTIILSLFDPLQNTFYRAVRILTFVKSLQYNEKIEDLDKLIVSNFRREQYRDLLSILAINLFLAHILSVAMNMMALLNPERNWLTQKGIESSPWFQRYIWGYYWGTTVMLTVGFGDLAATNTQEAFCLTFIELISCLTLSYNINCLGNILSNLRMRNLERRSNLKTFNSMIKMSQISEELENRVNSFIEGNKLIKEEFNFHEQDELLESIPKDLKIEFLREANLRIFGNLQFLRDFTMRSKKLLAQRIIKKVAHPQQLLIKKGDHLKLMILKKGQVTFCIRKYNNQSSSVVINTIKTDDKDQQKLISLGFIKTNSSMCDIRSQSYSILYELETEDIIKILKQSRIDYEHYCVLRDKSESRSNDNQPLPCKQCANEFHLKLNCPKLHYIPVRQHIIHKYLYRTARQKSSRRIFKREKIYLMTLKQAKMNRLEMDEFKDQNPYVYIRMQNMISSDLESMDSVEAKSYQTETTEKKKQKILNQFKAYVQNHTQETNFWEVQVDTMHNWQYYFNNDNPSNIKAQTKKKINRRSL